MARPLDLLPLLLLALAACKDGGDDKGDTDTDLVDTETVDTEVVDSDTDTVDSDTDVQGEVFESSYGWTCATGVDCQDVFDVPLELGAEVTFEATDVTGDSIAQIALYAPSEPLGGENLLTDGTTEYLCGYTDGCSSLTAGQSVDGFTAFAAGTYRFAVTRNYGESCGGSGTYTLRITSSLPIGDVVQSVEDGASEASGASCPI